MLAGAEAPKVSMPMTTPLDPTYLSHPRVEPASRDTLAVTSRGSTDALYSGLCSSNSSQQTMDTTRTPLPSSRSTLAAFSTISTSEPVDRRMTSGVPLELSLRRGTAGGGKKITRGLRDEWPRVFLTHLLPRSTTERILIRSIRICASMLPTELPLGQLLILTTSSTLMHVTVFHMR